MTRWLAFALVLPLSTTLVGMTPPSDAPAKPKLVLVKAVDVSATEFKWEPALITVSPGDTVRFEQTTTTPHNVEFKAAPAGAELGEAKMGPFLVTAGEHYDIVIDKRFTAGLYQYVCTPHEVMGMKGSITVGAAGK